MRTIELRSVHWPMSTALWNMNWRFLSCWQTGFALPSLSPQIKGWRNKIITLQCLDPTKGAISSMHTYILSGWKPHAKLNVSVAKHFFFTYCEHQQLYFSSLFASKCPRSLWIHIARIIWILISTPAPFPRTHFPLEKFLWTFVIEAKGFFFLVS